MYRRVLGAVLGCLLIAAPAVAIEPFVIKDIRVEGIQRTEAGTVFSYLPVKVGDTLDDAKATAAIKALFGTGFFKDVRLEAEGGVLVILVEERPAIAQITITGVKEFDENQLKTGLREAGIAESRIFDRAVLDKAEQEIKRQYLSRGKYGVTIATTVTPLERNRVAIAFTVTEGEFAKIRQINIVGNEAFTENDLVGLFVLRTPGWLTWYTKDDQYSRQKLAADLETLRSFYQNRGYLEFTIDSTQVSITPDKQDIYITVNVTEGLKYKISGVKLAGDTVVPEAELRGLIRIGPGDVFSRQKITESTKLIGDRLGNEGYAFANVNVVPDIDRERREAAFTFFVDPGRRVYVRRVNIAGNTRTRDEVIRREFRQFEGAWYSGEKINRSRQRVDRLGYFKDVNVETPAVPGTTDQVDVNMSVVEKPSGNLLLGAGFSSTDGIVLSGSVSQTNAFGTGNQLSVTINTSRVNTVYALSFTNPYATPEGVSRGFDIYRRDTDSTDLAVGAYSTSTQGFMLRFGVPISEDNGIFLSGGVERTSIGLFGNSPLRYIEFVRQFGDETWAYLLNASWGSDRRDSVIYPTRGLLQRTSAELGLPGGDLTYYKLNYQAQWYYPITPMFTLMLNGEIGYGDGYDNKPLPFFKNYYAGGVTSVRGYEASSLGPKDALNEAIGGNQRYVGNMEVLFPMPGMTNDRSVRLAWFVDAGAVKGAAPLSTFTESESFRYSTGLAVNWISPLGPLRFSFAQPLNETNLDKVQRFQFQFGSSF